MAIIEVKTQSNAVTNVDKPPDGHSEDPPAKAVAFNSAATGAGDSDVISPFEAEIVKETKQYCDPVTFSEQRVVRLTRQLKLSQRENAMENISHAVNDVMNAYYDMEPVEETKRSNTPHPVQGCAERPTQTDSTIPLPYPGPITPNAVTSSVADKEQSELQKAIEESLLCSQRTQVASSYLSALPENPEELLRTTQPAGIHNIGQTCWFSVIAQLLFHLPRYRQIIYTLTPEIWAQNPTPTESLKEDASERDVLVALRQLFAHMEASNRKFLDPAPSLTVISAFNRKNDTEAGELIGAQQDAVEMLMRITDWLERALHKASRMTKAPLSIDTTGQSQAAASRLSAMEISPAMSSRAGSVMDVQQQGGEEGGAPTHTQPSPAGPLHQAPAGPLPMHPPQTGLPPNDSLPPPHEESIPQLPETVNESAEWVNSPLEPIFHGTTVERKRREDGSVESYRTTNTLQMFLLDVDQPNLHDAFEQHNFSPKNQIWYDNLPAVLIVSLKRFRFDAGTSGVHKVNTAFDFPSVLCMDRYLLRNEALVSSLMEERNRLRALLADVRAQLKGYADFPLGSSSSRLADILQSTSIFIEGSAHSHAKSDDPQPITTSSPPSFVEQRSPVFPRGCDDLPPEVKHNLLIGLQHLREVAARKEAALRLRESELVSRIECIYEREELMREQYELHAVVIHEGAANMGHYWAYVRGRSQCSWQKMNDRAVEECTWDQIERDAYGRELPSTSAYCMVYVRRDAQWLMQEQSDSREAALEQLPTDLREDVRGANAELCREVNAHRARNPPSDVEMKDGRPRRERDVAIFDPDNLSHPLSRDVSPLFISAEERQKLDDEVFSLHRIMTPLYRPNMNSDTAFANALRAVVTGAIKPILHKLDPVAFKVGQAPQGLEKYTSDHLRGLYDTLISEWYELSADMAPRDCRTCVLDLWKALGFGMPAKLHRYIVGRALRIADWPYLSEIAREDVVSFEQNNRSQDYIQMFKRCMYICEMLRHLWALLKLSAQHISKVSAVLTSENVNAYAKDWTNLVPLGYSTAMFHQQLVEIVQNIGAKVNRRADLEYCIAETFMVRGVLIVPVLRVYALIVYCLQCEDIKDEEFNVLLPLAVRTQFYASVNLVAVWAEGRAGMQPDLACRKVIDHLIEVLHLFANTPTPHRNADLKANIINSITRAADPTRPLTISPIVITPTSFDLYTEHRQAMLLRMEVGLSDEADAVCTYSRLMQETVQVVTNLVQF